MEGHITLGIKTLIAFIFSGAFLVTYLVLPSIIGVVVRKNFMDDPNQRSSHKKKVPTMGGVAFFLTLMISFFLLKRWDLENISLSIIAGISILFVLGLKDDLVGVSPVTKLMGQILVCGFILSQNQMIITSLNGFAGIYDVSKLWIYPLSCFLMVTIINAFNLIDGIDGLAAITGIVISLVYAIIFYYTGDYFFSFLAIVVMGTLTAFLRYNFSRYKRKIFMGDTGSLVIGFVLSVLCIRFLAIPYESMGKLPFKSEMIPVVVVSILIVPLFDTFRVFTIRILNKRSPFTADKNHIHHILTKLGLSHKQTSLVIGAFNILFVLVFIAFSSGSDSSIPVIFLFILLTTGLIYLFHRLDFSSSNLRIRVIIRRKWSLIKRRLGFEKRNE